MVTAHPWVKEGGDASDMPLDISVLSNMREFVKYSRLKQLALRVMPFLSESALNLRLKMSFSGGVSTGICSIFVYVIFLVVLFTSIIMLYAFWFAGTREYSGIGRD